MEPQKPQRVGIIGSVSIGIACLEVVGFLIVLYIHAATRNSHDFSGLAVLPFIWSMYFLAALHAICLIGQIIKDTSRGKSVPVVYASALVTLFAILGLFGIGYRVAFIG